MSWLAEVERKRDNFFRKVEKAAPTRYMDARSRKHSWTYVATKITFTPSPLYPWNPGLARAIRDFTKGALRPIWITDVYRTPENSSSPKLEKFGRHGLAQKCKTSQAQFWHEGVPYKIWYQWVGEKDKRAADLPGAYVPFDGRAMKLVQANYRDRTTDEIKKLYSGLEDAHEKALDYRVEEMQRLEDELQKYAKKKLESLSDVEIKNYFLNRDLTSQPLTGNASVLVGKHS